MSITTTIMLAQQIASTKDRWRGLSSVIWVQSGHCVGGCQVRHGDHCDAKI
jgi:hypothetical protein